MEKVKNSSAGVFEKFLRKSSNLFFVIHKDGVIHKANPFAKRQLGEDIEGRPFEEIILDFYSTFELSDIKKDTEAIYPLNLKRESGLPQTYYFRFEWLGDYIYAIGELDNDELENVRKEILSLNEELNNLTRQLHKKNAELNLLNQEKNQFLGMAAHDLRKPIGLVISYSDFLLDEAADELDDEHVGFLNTIMKSCTFMKRLVDDFLDVSAIEAGRFDLDLQYANILDVLKQSLLLNNLQAKKRKISLNIEAQEAIPMITMDSSKIEQVITNLVSNAIEHSGPDSHVDVNLQVVNSDISFSVKDQGPGIAAEELDRLFKPFVKISTKKMGGEKSTGLGMLITRKIIEAHQGRIWVESEVGQGTSVFFTLPLERKTR